MACRLSAAVPASHRRPLWGKPQPHAALLPISGGAEALARQHSRLYLESLARLGIDPKQHDIRFIQDDWESPTLGAWGLGWEVRLDGMEITQFTYFQEIGGIELSPITGEITYGTERIAMYLQQVNNVYDLAWTESDQIWRHSSRNRGAVLRVTILKKGTSRC